MTAPLLTTKLYIPPLRPNLVPRTHLIRRLDEGLHLGHRLTLISAPAGFGKTTLLSEWASSHEHPVAWISLDEGDNDPVHFLTYFIASLQTVEASTGEGVLNALQAAQTPPIESVLTGLVNEIASIPEQFVLVLDDYHVIDAQPIHDALSFLLDHLPPQMHLVISARADPPLPIARLRGRGQLTELRQNDLRFTLDEATEFLNQTTGLELTAANISALASRTEGWIAGLQMAAISMQGREDIDGFIHAFTGSNRYILDYLVEEVLRRQPGDIQTFLLQTSILDRLTGPLCDAVLGIADSSLQVLEHLDRANLFVVSLDDRREWYRYHHLFADLLRRRLRQEQPDMVPTLHCRASRWYEQNGLPAEAIEHALCAGNPERAAQLIEQTVESTMLRSEVATLQSWIEALPDDLVRGHPLLCVYHALALVLSGHPLEAAEARVQEAIEADTAGTFSGEVTAFRALIAAYQGKARESAELSRRAVEILPDERLFFRSFVAGFLGLSYLYTGEVEAATQAFSEAARIGRQAGNLTIAALALCHLAELAAIKSQIREASVIYEQALESATDEQGRRKPIAGMALMGLGRVLYEQNDLDAATRYLTEGIELVKKWGEVAAFQGYIGLALVRQVQGDSAGATKAMQAAQEIAIKFDAMQVDDFQAALYQTRLWILQGNIEAAERWVQDRGLDRDTELEETTTDSRFLRTAERTTLAQVRIAQGRPGEALAVLEPLAQTAEDAGWVVLLVKALALTSVAHYMQGDLSQAMTVLEHVLRLAEPGGYVRTFVDEGAPMIQLLRHAASQGIAPQYVSMLLAAYQPPEQAQAGETPIHPHTQPLIEPLSERELQVLRLLTTSLSSREMAQELFISRDTARSHIKSIYGKLNVHSRREAVQRAEELGLL